MRKNAALLASSAQHRKRHPFTALSKWASSRLGHPVTFTLAVAVVFAWLVTGPLFHFSNTWQLFINTGTTIVTFLMVFLIQSTQNRDSAAVQIKLDELIRADKDAHTVLLDLEELTEKELLEMKSKYIALASAARAALRKGKNDKGSPELPL